MSKAVKKVTKKVKKFASKSIQMFDPGMDALMGISKGEEQKKQAERMAQIAEGQATQQATNTAEQARASAMAIQTDADRQRILAEQQQQQADQQAPAPTVEIAPVSTEAQARRKKFQTPQVGGTGGGGASIRL